MKFEEVIAEHGESPLETYRSTIVAAKLQPTYRSKVDRSTMVTIRMPYFKDAIQAFQTEFPTITLEVITEKVNNHVSVGQNMKDVIENVRIVLQNLVNPKD